MNSGPFSNLDIFRAYDIRGVYGTDLNEQIAERIGYAIGSYLGARRKVAVARDIRPSSEYLSESMIDGIIASGVDVIDIGIVPSPVLYFTVRNMNLAGGVMTTASHLPSEWNGFKICDKDGIVISQEAGLSQIRELFIDGSVKPVHSGHKSISQKANTDYIEYIREVVAVSSALNITIDYGNSVTALVVPELMKRLGLQVYELSKELKSINQDRDSEPSDESLINLRSAVMANKSDLGIAYDGDGDRVAFVDEKGKILWSGNTTIPVFAEHYLQEHGGGKIVHDVTCSRGVSERILALGGEPVEIKVGSGYCAVEIKKQNALFGGQYSGHMSFPEMGCTDDAIFASLKMLEIISKGYKLSQLVSRIPVHPATKLQMIDCADKEKFLVVERVIQLSTDEGYMVSDIDGAKIHDDRDVSWVLVRASNTSPVIRINAEGETREDAERMHGVGERLVREAMLND